MTRGNTENLIIARANKPLGRFPLNSSVTSITPAVRAILAKRPLVVNSTFVKFDKNYTKFMEN